jgi:hypothetical protein
MFFIAVIVVGPGLGCGELGHSALEAGLESLPCDLWLPIYAVHNESQDFMLRRNMRHIGRQTAQCFINNAQDAIPAMR